MPSRAQIRELLEPYLASDEQEDGEIDAYCPLHEDQQRSARINFKKNLWYCFAGCGSGTLKSLFTQIEGDEREVKHHKVKREEQITEGHVRGWHSSLMSNKEEMMRMRDLRGLRSKTLKKFEIGWDRDAKAFTIPVRESGKLVNVRRYRPGHDSKKIWSTKGSHPALYPESILSEDSIVISEGEMDAILCWQYNIPAISGTGGSSVWRDGWSRALAGKKVWIVYDADDAGKKGAKKVARSVAPFVSELHIVELPLDIKGGDITDCFVTLGWSRAKFLRMMVKHSRQVKLAAKEGERESVDVTVLDSFDAALLGRSLKISAMVTGRRNPPYLLPKLVKYECDQDAGKPCQRCPMNTSGSGDLVIKPTSDAILQLIDANDKKMTAVLDQMMGVRCKLNFSREVVEGQSVEELFLRPSIDRFSEREDFTAYRRIYNAGNHDTKANQVVTVIGKMLPSPKTQRNEFLAWEVDQVQSSIDKFRVDDDVIKKLLPFQPSEDETPLEKMLHIARDMELNVTKIYGRPELHVAMDLVYHSLLDFPFANGYIERGWLDLLVVGDTRTGKSEVAKQLVRHYQAGRIVDCESATYAGVVGGLQQLTAGNEWAITWGAIPLSDKRLVVLDEVSGLEPEKIAQMSSIRSSGIAQITKVQSETTMARTRLIWLSNPRGGRVANYTYGIHMLKPLIGNPEDIARFDFAMSVSSDEVSAQLIHDHKDDRDKPFYTSDMCHARVMWAWSRTKDQVVWEGEAEDLCFEAGVRLGAMYVEDPPLIQQANVRMKIARLAVALAAATFSTDEEGELLLVQERHVWDACDFLHKLYSKGAFGYYASSQQALRHREKARDNIKKMKRYLSGHPELVSFLKSTSGKFRVVDVEQMLNLSKETAQSHVSELYQARMVQRVSASIIIQPELHEILRDMEEEE